MSAAPEAKVSATLDGRGRLLDMLQGRGHLYVVTAILISCLLWALESTAASPPQGLNPGSPLYCMLTPRLSAHEVKWRDRQPFLESKGYMLRPRLRPGWTPSWISATGEHHEPERKLFEDWARLPVSQNEYLIDALVYIFRLASPFPR